MKIETFVFNKTRGFQDPELIVVCGRPQLDPLGIPFAIARNLAIAYQIPVGIFSLEVKKEKLILNAFAANLDLSVSQITEGRIPQEKFAQLVKINSQIADLLIYINDSPTLSAESIELIIATHPTDKSLGAIVIDYLQMFDGTKDDLKRLAAGLGIPIILLSSHLDSNDRLIAFQEGSTALTEVSI